MVIAVDPSIRMTPEGTRVLFSGISWETYERLSQEIEHNGRNCRITYSHGEMEVEMPTRLHELIVALVSQMLEQYCHATGTPFMPTGATTWRRRLKETGIEADESYYIQHVEAAESASDENPDRCPPPDLAIETEISVPLIPKLPIYAAIGVPEVWHITGEFQTHILLLQPDGTYQPVEHSRAAPLFTPELLKTWLTRRSKGKHFDTIQQFRAEVLATLA